MTRLNQVKGTCVYVGPLNGHSLVPHSSDNGFSGSPRFPMLTTPPSRLLQTCSAFKTLPHPLTLVNLYSQLLSSHTTLTFEY